jgi:hypothetical protein
LKLLNDENEAYSLRVSAAELLGKGFAMWRTSIKDVDNLIQQLFSLSLVSKPANIRATAHQALMLIGSAEPKQFVISLGQYILEVHYADNLTGKPANVSQHSAAIMTLGSLIKQVTYNAASKLIMNIGSCCFATNTTQISRNYCSIS